MKVTQKWIVTTWRVKSGHKRASMKHVKTEHLARGGTWTETTKFPFTASCAQSVKQLKRLADELNLQQVTPGQTDAVNEVIAKINRSSKRRS